MQNHIYDWYQIIAPNPDETMLQMKKKAIEELEKKIIDSDQWDLLIECIAVACGDSSIVEVGSNYVSEAIKSFKSVQISFPTSVTENSLELRVASGVILEDIIAKENDEAIEDSYKEIVFTLIQSVLGLKGLPPEQYLAARINNLKNLAEKLMEDYARDLRHRAAIDISIFKDSNLPVDQSSWDVFCGSVSTVFNELEQQSIADREEIELLWWSNNGMSRQLRMPLSSLSPEKAAFHAGLDVAELSILPPLQSISEIITKAIEKDRKTKSLIGKPLNVLLVKKETGLWSLIAPTDESIQRIIRNSPAVFPLSWLGMRVTESKGLPEGLFNEFEEKTGISGEYLLTPNKLALQVFREQISKSLIIGE